MTGTLFPISGDDIKVTSDDCYTPRWVFDAMGLAFDLDVAAPPGGPWHVPAARYYTAEDDGLAQPWDGLVWCNPPYSSITPWVHRWASHPRGVLLSMLAPATKWMPEIVRSAEAFSICAIGSNQTNGFIRPDGGFMRPRFPVFVAFRGVGTEPAERLAAADPYGAVLYGRNPS